MSFVVMFEENFSNPILVGWNYYFLMEGKKNIKVIKERIVLI